MLQACEFTSAASWMLVIQSRSIFGETTSFIKTDRVFGKQIEDSSLLAGHSGGGALLYFLGR
jgi:hypothetical protein